MFLLKHVKFSRFRGKMLIYWQKKQKQTNDRWKNCSTVIGRRLDVSRPKQQLVCRLGSASWFRLLVPPLATEQVRRWPADTKEHLWGSTWSPGAPVRSWTNPRRHARRVASTHFTVFWNTLPPPPSTPHSPLQHLSQAPVTSLQHRTQRLGSWNKTNVY